NKKVNMPAHATIGLTWLVERNAFKHMSLDRRAKALIRVKDVLIVGALLSAVANTMVGKKLARELPGGAPKPGDTRSTHTILAPYKRYFKVMGPVHMALVGATILIGPYLNAAVLRSKKRGLLGRIFRR